MSLRDNLHVMRPGDEDPTSETVYELFVIQSGYERGTMTVELRAARTGSPNGARRPLWFWPSRPYASREDVLVYLEDCVRDLEYALNVYRLEIIHPGIRAFSRNNKPQEHLNGVLNGLLAGMRNFACLGVNRELAGACASSVQRIVIRVTKISREAAQIAAAREAGHPAVR